MTIHEIVSAYLLPVIGAALAALAGFIGAQLKKIYQKHVDDKTKEAVVRTCVKAVEQLYHDLGGPEKMEKARAGIVQMLKEKGIAISELEMEMLIESVVSEFNYGFNKTVPAVGDSSAAPQHDKKTEEAGAEKPLTEDDEGASR